MITINAVAPIRICDIGGWTDTWFAGHGKVVNIAVSPYVSVSVRSTPGSAVVLDVVDYGDRYQFDPAGERPGRHPLLEAAVGAAELPGGAGLEITVHSEAPPGGSTGTSAAVVVALIGVLDALTPGRLSAAALAAAAHRVEVEELGLQSGIQDQICSAHGGINFIEMAEYPAATVSPVVVSPSVWTELERRLSLVYLGASHQSSKVHEGVIEQLEREGPSSPRLDALRGLAEEARAALIGGDLRSFGQVMTANTDAQAALHAELVSDDAAAVIELARQHGAVGWKVNGAGGEGGSLTVLNGTGASAAAKQELEGAVAAADPRYRVMPIALSRDGLRVWNSAKDG